MPRALMAKLHSFFSANSRRWASDITPSTVSRVCSGDSGVLVTGRILPCTFMLGATPAVMNRSEAPFSTISRSSFSNSIMPSSRGASRARQCDLSEALAHLGLLARRIPGHQAAGYQILQAHIQGLHADIAAGLDRRIHLRHLVLTDQVADGRGADHDF